MSHDDLEDRLEACCTIVVSICRPAPGPPTSSRGRFGGPGGVVGLCRLRCRRHSPWLPWPPDLR